MTFSSTRGGVKNASFEEVLFSGFAVDGGLFMPEKIPQIDSKTLLSWSSLPYIELVKEICALFIPVDVMPRQDINDVINTAFSRFRHKDIINLARLKDKLNILELWHGMTYAFKDLALSCVGQFLQYFLNKRNKHVTVLVGTAGDTGSAAIESVRGLKWIDIIVMLPKGRCTRIQELQMTTVIEDNVTVFSVDGTSDEIDGIIRKLFADTAFAKKHNLMSLNSINWCRIMVQIAHFFYAYFVCATSKLEDSLAVVEVVVPTGGAGNITAGCIARKMGLPVQLVAAVNENDILHRTVLHGDFSLAESVKASLSSAMDIQEPYNLERIFWLLSGMDSPLIKKMMEEFEKSKRLQLPAYLHKSIKDNVTSCTVSDADVIHTIRHCWDENHYLLCPHTAVAVTYHYRQSDIISKSIARCCLATASAVKFPEAVQKAGLTPEVTTDIKMLEEKSTRFAVMKKEDEWEQILRDTVEAIAIRRES